jgi:4'-phosphopantetheinyl transferase
MQASASVTASGDSKAAIGEALKQALSGNRLQSISLHDERGDVLWLDEGALGPDEHNLVVEAAAALSAGPDKTYVFQNIGDGRSAAFLQLWTHKEAVLKALGEGLSFGLDRVEFDLSEGGQAGPMRRIASDAGRPGEWQLRRFAPTAGVTGSIAWRGPPRGLQLFRLLP